MAQQFTVRGRVKPLFNGDGLPVGFEVVRSASRGVLSEAPLQFQELQLRFSGARRRTRTYSNASTSSVGKWKKFRSNDLSNEKTEEVWEEITEETEFEKDELSSFRGLVLDISYRPVNVVCWKRAICLEFMEKADVLEYYDQTVNSPSGSYYIPAVLRVPHLLQIVKRRRIKRALSRKNILHRDNYTCQYCSSEDNLTIDHVLPIACGGEWTWENLVTACSRCNSRKGHKTPEEASMELMKVPKVLLVFIEVASYLQAPKDYDILAIPLTSLAQKMLRSKTGTPEEWRQYLSMPSAGP